jgi:hypothetical protein
MHYIGIDPGKTGALACISSLGIFHSAIPNLNPNGLIDWIHDIKPSRLTHLWYIEKAAVFPKNGAVSMFNYGKGYGETLGILMALNQRFELIPPTVWPKELGITKESKKDKTPNIKLAYDLFPDLDFRASSRCKNPHQGFIDAVLIAEYGRRTNQRLTH